MYGVRGAKSWLRVKSSRDKAFVRQKTRRENAQTRKRKLANAHANYL